MGDIYDVATYQPKKSLGSLLSRVRVEMLAALDQGAQCRQAARAAGAERGAVHHHREPGAVRRNRSRPRICARASRTMRVR